MQLYPGDTVRFNITCKQHANFHEGVGLIISLNATTQRYQILWDDNKRNDCYEHELIKLDSMDENVLFRTIERLLSGS